MINWNNVYKLSPGEFSEDPDKYAEPELIYSLGKLRKLVGVRVFPSPVSGALARTYGSKNSQHYAVDRLSTASDVFIEGVPMDILTLILFSGLFRGIGVYLDTTGPDGLPWVMFHIDLRLRKNTHPLIWIYQKVKTNSGIVTMYRYPQSDSQFWSLLNDPRFFKNKMYGVA